MREGGRLNISAVSVKTGLSQLNPGYALPSLPPSSPPRSDAAVSRSPFLFEQFCPSPLPPLPQPPPPAPAFSLSYSLKQLPSLLPREGARGRIKIAFPASRFLPAPPLFFTSLCSIHQMSARVFGLKRRLLLPRAAAASSHAVRSPLTQG